MANLADIPILQGDLDSRMERMISFMNERIEVDRWDDSGIEKKFAKQSALDILHDENVMYMNPCLDYTLVAYETLRKSGAEPILVIEELDSKYGEGSDLHFAIEFLQEGEKYNIDFFRNNKVLLKRGEYGSPFEDQNTFQIIRVEKNLDATKNISDNICDVAEMLFSFDLRTQVKRLKSYNSENSFEVYKRQIGADAKLELVPLHVSYDTFDVMIAAAARYARENGEGYTIRGDKRIVSAETTSSYSEPENLLKARMAKGKIDEKELRMGEMFGAYIAKNLGRYPDLHKFMQSLTDKEKVIVSAGRLSNHHGAEYEFASNEKGFGVKIQKDENSIDLNFVTDGTSMLANKKILKGEFDKQLLKPIRQYL